MNGRNLFAELKRRNVLKVALVYSVVSWLLIQIASVLLPIFGAPSWAMKAVVVFFAFGFVISVVISWAFEATPKGLKRTEDVPPEVAVTLPTWSRRKFGTFIISIAVIAFALSAYQLLRPQPAARSVQNKPVSILQRSNGAAPGENVSDTRPGERIIRDLDAQWSRAAGAKDLEKCVGNYSDDAIVLPANAAAATGREAIRSVWKELLAGRGLAMSWTTTKVEVSKSGDMAYSSGSYELSMTDPTGKPINDRGKYLEIWKKQADGKWKCGVDIWNSDLAASAVGSAQKK